MVSMRSSSKVAVSSGFARADWRASIQKGDFTTGLVTSVAATYAGIKIGPYRAMLTPADFAWTAHKSPAELLKVGDAVEVTFFPTGTTSNYAERIPPVKRGYR